MNRRVLQSAVALIFFVSLVLPACSPPPEPVAEAALPVPTKAKKKTPVPAQKKATQPSPKATQAPAGGSVKSGDHVNLPSSPDVPPADVIQQIAWGAVGGPMDCEKFCISIDGDTLFLTKFTPGQSVRIEVYETTGEIQAYEIASFLTEIPVNTDSKGKFQLRFDRDMQDIEILVVNTDGKILARSPWNAQSLEEVQEELACPGKLKSRVSMGMKVRVTITNGIPLRIRTKPSKESKTWIADLAEGTKMKIVDGPQCIFGWVWWKVSTENNYKGWVAEGDQKTWFIEPLK